MNDADQWKKHLRKSFRSADRLCAFLGLDPAHAPYKIADTPDFPLLVTESFAVRMRKKEWYDPLLLQVLPRKQECMERRGFSVDPLAEKGPSQSCLLYKYKSRALILAFSSCPIHCRFCFRRCLQPKNPLPHFEKIISRIRRDHSLNEIILSGGDPFMLDNRTLSSLLSRFAAIGHLRTIRIHTRVPVALPGRIDNNLLDLLSRLAEKNSCVIVVHANHPAELKTDCLEALARLRTTGSILLNQAVLLRGINDDVKTLTQLFQSLVAHGVLPYYLHQLDRVCGAWHFEVAAKKGKSLMETARRWLPGYAVPRYVREIPGKPYKTILY
jgi:EF-P beta-lysylation protein EpmB